MRTIILRPQFFRNEQVSDVSFEARILLMGIWSISADPIEDRPRRIRAEVFPFNLDLDCEPLLRQLASVGLIRRENGLIEVLNPYAIFGRANIDVPGRKEWLRLGNALRRAVFERDGRLCRYCGTATGPFDIDHATPLSRGGTNDLANLVVACSACNGAKGAKTPDEFLGACDAD